MTACEESNVTFWLRADARNVRPLFAFGPKTGENWYKWYNCKLKSEEK